MNCDIFFRFKFCSTISVCCVWEFKAHGSWNNSSCIIANWWHNINGSWPWKRTSIVSSFDFYNNFCHRGFSGLFGFFQVTRKKQRTCLFPKIMSFLISWHVSLFGFVWYQENNIVTYSYTTYISDWKLFCLWCIWC